MTDKSFLEDLARKLSKVLPENFHKIQKDVEKNFHSILKTAFEKLDLVTREEFDAQTKVLARTRQKLDDLLLRIKDLENKN